MQYKTNIDKTLMQTIKKGKLRAIILNDICYKIKKQITGGLKDKGK